MTLEETLRRFDAVPFAAEVELGSLAMSIGEIFSLREGSVLRTDHPAGAPVGLHVGGVELAKADVVVIDDSLSVRITRMLDKSKTPVGSNGIS